MKTTTRGRVLWTAFALALAALAAVAVVRHQAARGTAVEGADAHAPAAARYHCPMHPMMLSDHPGDCRICGMRLVPIGHGSDDDPADPAPAAPPAGRKIVYRSTMNPGEISDRPGKDSMGMEMERVEIEDPAGAAGVEGLAGVRVSSRKQQLIGVRTATVRRAPIVRSIRTVGVVTADERRLHHVHTKIEGWIETLHVNTTGELVRRGEALLSIYSPEILATQEEYVLALKARGHLAEGALAGAGARADALVESGRRRLLLFDLTPAQIDELERSGRPARTVTLYAPISGYVTRRGVTQGEKIDSSTTLLDIADLSRVWVMASVYEYELPFVRPGQAATVSLSYLPGRAYEGKVTLVYPVVEGATRTIQVRVELANPDLALKPEMYAQVDLHADLGERLSVPQGAVLSSGDRDIVFVAQGEGFFEPREVTVGVRLPDTVEILSGLAEGETVVASGGFLIDSESRLKAALEAAAAAPKDRGKPE